MTKRAPHPEPPVTATDTIFEAILTEILRGTYLPGTRLPAERELSQMHGASRPTLREALRRLSEWRVVESRRGSGVTVREQREWSIEVLPAYLRYAPNPPIADILADLLALRQALLRTMLTRSCGRLNKDDIAELRTSVAAAWEAKSGSAFMKADLLFVRTIVERAKFLPATWFLNRLSSVYLDLAHTVGPVLTAPDDYLDSYEAIIDALAAGSRKRVVKLFDDYMERHDRRLLTLLGVPQ